MMIIKLSKIASFSLVVVTLILVSNRKLFSWAASDDTIDATQSIKGNETLVSSQGRFELGFFSPGNTKNWYIGIWYKQVRGRTPVWVANRENPVRNISESALRIINGVLVVINETNDIVWSSSNTTSSTAAKNPIAQLLDSGNLVLRYANNERPEDYLWQSFDHLTDTFLPDMDFGWNPMNGKERYLSSWRSDDDPSPGDFTHHLDVNGSPQGVTRRAGKVVTYRNGPWNGIFMSGTPNVQNDQTFKYGLYSQNGTSFFRQDSTEGRVISRSALSPAGLLEALIWVERTNTWTLFMSFPRDHCDVYKLCGAYGVCNNGMSPVCSCLEKFVPKDPQGWARLDWSNGCFRRAALNCSKGDGFLKYSNVKLPDARNSWQNEKMTIEECKDECLKNCDCMAYAKLDIRGRGSGCVLWFGDLVDMRVLSADGEEIYVRVASSEIEYNGKMRQVLLFPSLYVTGVVIVILAAYLLSSKKIRTVKWRGKGRSNRIGEDFELPFYDFDTIVRATDNFSTENKLGEGGYGPVYKGLLQEEGEYIAVKRLSTDSTQGLEEFKNEVNFISNLQHRNLVKLLGYCIHEQEKLLVYEYLPNKSLDSILFDEKNGKLLESKKRLQIVEGIARGLVYLHQDSRLRIVHRDLKASNILLDKDMNPKISDFGLARTFKDNVSEDKTKRISGTYGYMSPEYAVRGKFSMKSDVFSFGVLVLEIVSGKRNSSFYGSTGQNVNLLGHAWILHKEGRSRELVDECLRSAEDGIFDMLRLIRVGLLCVQHSPEDRPTMDSVVSMLSSGDASVAPKEPGFFARSEWAGEERRRRVVSRNDVTITVLDGR